MYNELFLHMIKLLQNDISFFFIKVQMVQEKMNLYLNLPILIYVFCVHTWTFDDGMTYKYLKS